MAGQRELSRRAPFPGSQLIWLLYKPFDPTVQSIFQVLTLDKRWLGALACLCLIFAPVYFYVEVGAHWHVFSITIIGLLAAWAHND